MIPFQIFLDSINDLSFWSNTPVFCFQGQEFASCFFIQLFEHLSQKNILPTLMQHLAVHSLSKETVRATLAQSFLGSCTFYWIGNSNAAEKWNKELVQDLCIYQGPNIVAFFATHDHKISSSETIKHIILDSTIHFDQFLKLQNIFGSSFPDKKMSLVRKIFKVHPNISLDVACMLMNYIELISIKMIPQSEHYLFSLVSTLPSLTQLSEYFFAKEAEKFFAVWAAVHQEYPDIFWITFWSEHLWRAYHVLGYLEKKDFVSAKKMSFRLPYSFLKKDWQLHTQQQLIQKFENLYAIDYTLKRGSTFHALDLFYAHHFQQ